MSTCRRRWPWGARTVEVPMARIANWHRLEALASVLADQRRPGDELRVAVENVLKQLDWKEPR